MKIAIVGPAYPYRGGIANFSERLANEFICQQDEVHLFTFKMMYPDFLFPGKTQYAETPLRFPLSIKRNIHSMNPINWISVGNEIKNQQFDILLCPYSIPFLAPSLGAISRKARENKHTKNISIIHNLNPHEQRIGDSILSDYFLNSFDIHIALSKKVQQDIIDKDPAYNTLYHPHPVYDIYGEALNKSIAKQKLNLDERSNYILFFGLIRDYKGLDILLYAMANNEIKNADIKLVIAGEFYSDKQPYLDIISKYHLNDNIIIYDRFIPEDEVNLYFSACDIVIQPYTHATQSGITQICYYFNKPMIVTNVGGLPETVPHNKVGFVVEPNEHEVANAILTFYRENKEQEFIENILMEKQQYSWKALVEKIKKIV